MVQNKTENILLHLPQGTGSYIPAKHGTVQALCKAINIDLFWQQT
jgi:hypothetical protein